MSRETAVLRGRQMAETGMTDACQIRRQTGETTTGGVITPTWTSLYDGPCRVQKQTQAQGAGTNVGEATVFLERLEVQLPMSVVGLAEGDQITITASSLDPDLVARVFAVRDVLVKTHATARRVGCIEVTS
jgi:hypothetical protein